MQPSTAQPYQATTAPSQTPQPTYAPNGTMNPSDYAQQRATLLQNLGQSPDQVATDQQRFYNPSGQAQSAVNPSGVTPANNAMAPANGLAGAIANTTNLINQTGGGSTLSGASQAAPPPATPPYQSSTAPGASQTGSQGLLQQMGQAIGNQQNPYNLLQGREQALGIPQQQQQVSGLRQAITNTSNLLNQITPSVEGRTADSLVNQAQASRMIGNESAPIQQQLSQLGTQSADAQNALQNLMAQATSEANMQNQGQQQNIQNLQSLFGNTMSSEQAQQTQSNFLAQQAQAKEQFEKNLALDQQKFGLSQQQADEQRRQFDAAQAQQQSQFSQTQGLEQQKLQASVQQFAQTFGLDQLKNQQAVDQFAQQMGLDKQKFQASVDQFNATQQQAATDAGNAERQRVFDRYMAGQQLAQTSDANAAKAQLALAQAQLDQYRAGGPPAGNP